MDGLDAALLNFVETSVLDTDDIIEKAREVEVSLKQRQQMTAFEQCWRPFHDSLNNNEDEVSDSIIEGIKNNFAMVSRSNLDAAVSILNELGRIKDADALIDFAKYNGGEEFWTSDDPFHRQVKDTRIRGIVEGRRKETQPIFNFETDLLAAAQNMKSEKLAQLASASVEQYQHLFENSTGPSLYANVYAALEYRKISNATDDMRKIVAKAEEALRRIGRKSKLNEIRVRKYDVSLDTPKGGASSESG